MAPGIFRPCVLWEGQLVDKPVIEGFLVEREFPRVGYRTLLLCARKVLHTDDCRSLILLGFEDITDRRAIEHQKEKLQHRTEALLKQKKMLLEEMQHRIVNSLQIIARILMLKARAVTSLPSSWRQRSRSSVDRLG
jgi:chemotaxis protein methyltransferase CheR